MGRGGGVGEEHWIAGYTLQAQRWVMARKLGAQTGSEVRSGTSMSLRTFLFLVSVTLRVQVSRVGLTSQSSEPQKLQPKTASVLETRAEF